MRRAPITVSLMGGLGNQLFQMATGLELARRNEVPLELDLTWFAQSLRRTAGGLVLRPYELGGIAADLQKAELPPGRIRELTRHVKDVGGRRAPGVVNRLPGPDHFEGGAGFDPSVLELPAGAHLKGYYASWRYFPTVATEMRARVLGAPPPESWGRQERARVSTERPIALHVRRGDYLALASTYGHVAPDYYKRAVGLLRDLRHAGPVWLFSDDPSGASDFLRGFVDLDRVIAPPSDCASVESMVAMSGAEALVIANSTFSWWSAFLEDRPDRHIVAPRPLWADPGMGEPRDWLLPHWLTVDCRRLS